MKDKVRLDIHMIGLGLARTRSQAAGLVAMNKVTVDGRLASKSGQMVSDRQTIKVIQDEVYVSRAGYKLASVAKSLKLEFEGKVMLDVGSSTGGFTDYALRRGAKKVIAVDVGTNQLHESLVGDPKIELHEKTDIRNVWLHQKSQMTKNKDQKVFIDAPDIIVIDVSFISLREILPHCSLLAAPDTLIVAMVKPQFEAQNAGVKHKGVIKNDSMRRKILSDFERWAKNVFVIKDKIDSKISGSKGNIERFYLLGKLS